MECGPLHFYTNIEFLVIYQLNIEIKKKIISLCWEIFSTEVTILKVCISEQKVTDSSKKLMIIALFNKRVQVPWLF